MYMFREWTGMLQQALILYLVVTFGFLVTVCESDCHWIKNPLTLKSRRQPGCWVGNEFHPFDSEWVSPKDCEECHCYRNGMECCSSDTVLEFNRKVCFAIKVNCTHRVVRRKNPAISCPFKVVQKNTDSTDSDDSTDSKDKILGIGKSSKVKSESKERNLMKVVNFIKFLQLKNAAQKNHSKSNSQERHVQEKNGKSNEKPQEGNAKSYNPDNNVQEHNVKSNPQENNAQEQKAKSNAEENQVQDKNTKDNSKETNVEEQKAKSNAEENQVQDKNTKGNSKEKYVQEQKVKGSTLKEGIKQHIANNLANIISKLQKNN
ncbi:uncharacterized protein [Pyxicephalus adspersus]|uniref:uncharacterized protein n=1 Tax=Pyxicephalus adspersus TaxID=30357 RepID=UPI003B59549C